MVIATTDIQLFQILKQKLGEKEAEALVSFVDAKLKEANDQNLIVAATKEDIANLRTELKTDIANARADMIKWMFIFWIGTIGVLSGIMSLLLNAYIKH
jgi:hypothetical protein